MEINKGYFSKMKTGEDFKKSAIENNIDYWPVHNCSMCGYECGYIFFMFEEAEVAYDHGCDCTRRRDKSKRDWSDVADQYNMQKHPDVIKKMNEYWRFENGTCDNVA